MRTKITISAIILTFLVLVSPVYIFEVHASKRSIVELTSDLMFTLSYYMDKKLNRHNPVFTEQAIHQAIARQSQTVNRQVRKKTFEIIVSWGTVAIPYLESAIEAKKFTDYSNDNLVTLEQIKLDVDLESIMSLIFNRNRDRENDDANNTSNGLYPHTKYFFYQLEKIDGGQKIMQRMKTRKSEQYFEYLSAALILFKDKSFLPGLILLKDHDNPKIAKFAHTTASELENLPSIYPLVDSYLADKNPLRRAAIIIDNFSKQTAQEDPRVLSILSDQLSDNSLRLISAQALASLGTKESIEKLKSILKWDNPIQVIRSLSLRDRNYSILKLFLSHPDKYVQQVTIRLLTDFPQAEINNLLLEKRLHADLNTRKLIDNTLYLRNQRNFLASTYMFFNGHFQKQNPLQRKSLYFGLFSDGKISYVRPPKWVFISFNFLLSLAIFWGILLVLNAVTPFHSYRFQLTMHIIFLSLILQNYFVAGHDLSRYHYGNYIALLLFLGIIFQKRASDNPDNTAIVHDRIGGARVWLIVPLILYFATPIFSTALHNAFSQFSYFAVILLLWFFTMGLLIEEYVVSWKFKPRSSKHKQWLGTFCSIAVYISIIVAIGQWINSTTKLDNALALQGYILLAPLFGVIIWQLFLTFKKSQHQIPPLSDTPSKNFTLISDNEMIILKRVKNTAKIKIRSGLWFFFDAIHLMIAAIIVLLFSNFWVYIVVVLPLIAMYSFDWSNSALFIFLFFNIIAAAGIASLIPIIRYFSSEIFQVKARHIRSGVPIFGAVFGDNKWRTRPQAELLTASEQKWFKNILDL